MSFRVLIVESLRMSWNSVRLNKLRSALSVLGITIGIFCIVSVYALVHSLELSLNNQFTKLGADVLFIQKWPWDDMGNNYPWWEYMKRPKSSPQDLQSLKKMADNDKVQTIAYAYNANFNVSNSKKTLSRISIRCVSHEFNEIQPIELEEGRYFTLDEARAGRSIAVIGNTIALELFGSVQNAINKHVRLGNKEVRIVGVAKHQGNNIIGASNDNLVYVPYKWSMGLANYRQSDDAQILVKATKGTDLDDLKFELEQLMRQVRRIKPKQESDFAVNKMTMITDAISGLFSQIRKIGFVIGGFAMLVGCFGVANIMFVSVKERTREIGVQKALGAKNFFISLQFLLESIWLSIGGGIIGLALVAGVLKILDSMARESMGGGVELILNGQDAILGIGISVLVGILAGFLPARSAAALNPVEAIRSS